MTVQSIQHMESLIVELAVRCLIRAGYRVGVRSPDGMVIHQGATMDLDAVVGAAAAARNAMLTVWGARFPAGYVLLTFGRIGHDVIADNSMSLETVLSPAVDLAEQFAQAQ